MEKEKWKIDHHPEAHVIHVPKRIHAVLLAFDGKIYYCDEDHATDTDGKRL